MEKRFVLINEIFENIFSLNNNFIQKNPKSKHFQYFAIIKNICNPTLSYIYKIFPFLSFAHATHK